MKVLSNLNSRFLKFFMILLAIFFSSQVFAVDEDNVFSIPVTFITDSGVNVGFSEARIDTVLKQESSLNQIHFDVIDSIDNKLETGTFYFYVQIYENQKIRVTINDIGPLKGNSGNESLAWINQGESVNRIAGSSTVSGIAVIEEDENVIINRPRVYNVGMDLAVQMDDLRNKNSNKFSSTLSFKVETI